MHKGAETVQRNFSCVRCKGCGKVVPFSSALPECRSCNGRLEVVMDVAGARKTISKESVQNSRERGIWRYRDLLPVINPNAIVTLGEGNTNLLRANSLAGIMGLKQLYIKDETSNPSGAFIDRGMTVDISRAKAIGSKGAACAWSGNLASSLAAYCARGGLRPRAYLQVEMDLVKLFQIVAYGAEIVQCDSQEDANRQLEAVQDEFYPVTYRNPFFLEGLKTTGFEVAEQLGWKTPDWTIVPTGNGSHLSMIHKGLMELEEAGFIEENGTRLVGVQVQGCSPIADLMHKTDTRHRRSNSTFAKYIAIEKPAMAQEALDAIKESRGDAVAVSEKDILDAVSILARNEGIFAEPAAASAIAALRRLIDSRTIDRSDSVACIITGMGLKDPAVSRRIAMKNRTARRIISRFDSGQTGKRIGDTKLGILQILAGKGDYAYAIRKQLIERIGKKISLVCVYQHLTELQDLGMITVEKEERSPERRVRVYYALTDKGSSFLRTPPGESGS